MPLTPKALLDYMALPEEEQAKLDASPEIGPQLQSFKTLPREEQVKVLDGLGAPQPRSLLSQATDFASRVGSATLERWRTQGENVIDVAGSLLPTWDSSGTSRPLPGTTMAEKTQHVIGALSTLLGGGVFSPVGATSQVLSEKLGVPPEQARQQGDIAEMLTGLGLGLTGRVATDPEALGGLGRMLQRVGIGRTSEQTLQLERIAADLQGRGFPNIPLSSIDEWLNLPQAEKMRLVNQAPPLDVQAWSRSQPSVPSSPYRGPSTQEFPDLALLQRQRDAAEGRLPIPSGPSGPQPTAPSTTLPPELQDVVNGDAAAFLKPPVSEGTIPTAGEQMLQGTDLKKVAGQTGMGYFKGKDGTEVIFNPNLTKTSALKILDKRGELPTIVNGPGTAPKPSTPTDAVVVRSPDGTEIRTILTDTPEKTAAAIQAQPPTAQVEVKPAAEVVPQVIQDRMQAIRTQVEDARIVISTGKQFYRDQEGNIVKTGAAKSIREYLSGDFPELRDLPNVGPKEIVQAIDKDRGNKLYLQIKDAVEHQMTREAANPEAVVTRPSDFEEFSRAFDELAAQEKTPAVTGGIAAVKQPWEMTKAEYVDGHITSPAMHKYGVQKALAEGKPVPPEVLAEYPDLAKQVKPPTATQPKLFQTQATMPPEGLQAKAPQVEHGDLLKGFKPPEAPSPELPFQGEGEMHAGLPIPQKVKDAVKRLLPGGQGGWWNGLQEALATQAEKLPSELRVIKEAPNSAAISSVEGARATVANGATNLTKMPWAQAIRKYTPDQFKQLENQAVQIWEQGGKTGASLNQAIDAMPPEIQAMLRYRQSRLPIEQAARKVLGLPEIPETPGPYFPRLTEQGLQDIKAMARGRANLANDLQTTVRSFQQARSFPTMSQGEAAGMKYQDPRTAWAMREWHSLQLESTAQLMTNLEQKGVLFRTADAAKQASPVGKAFGIEGLPGSTQWFAPTNAEREFVMQNLTRADRGALGGLISLGNQLFRNPNLFNPAPHFTKNMLYKYVMSGGNPGAVASRMAEYERGTAPLVQRFKAVFPESETALSPGMTLDPFLRPDSIIAKSERAIGSINRPSSTAIFEHLDPALRYARWKQYVQSGMSDQAAANHVQVDLIRYGTRSDAVDFWKSIPLNFFVPWRTGTVTSLVKQVTSHPIRTAAFIGAVDYLREARYRQSGQWTHLPVDYIESPIAQAIQHHDPKTLAALAATTALFGPGGASTASTLRDAIDDIRGGDEKGRIINMFWGLSQLYNIPKEFQRFQQTGDGNHLVNILTSAAIAEHSALNYAPRRLGAYLPEGLPFMQKSNTVNIAEAIQAQRRARSEAIQTRRALRPRPSIEELLTVSP